MYWASISVAVIFSAAINWLNGSASGIAHDKQLAHKIAYDAAVRDASARCSGAVGDVTELNSASTYIASSDEWRFEVTVRVLCSGMEGGGM